jgi:hypothetical protein
MQTPPIPSSSFFSPPALKTKTLTLTVSPHRQRTLASLHRVHSPHTDAAVHTDKQWALNN